MLIFNPKRIFAMRGIEKPSGFLARIGFSYPTATKFLKLESSLVKIKNIERLCIALNCTPNDLFEWQNDGKVNLPENHSLNALHKGEAPKNLQQLIKDVPADKLTQIESLLNELKK